MCVYPFLLKLRGDEELNAKGVGLIGELERLVLLSILPLLLFLLLLFDFFRSLIDVLVVRLLEGDKGLPLLLPLLLPPAEEEEEEDFFNFFLGELTDVLAGFKVPKDIHIYIYIFNFICYYHCFELYSTEVIRED